MVLNEKIELINKYKDIINATINSTIDTYANFIDPVKDDNGEIKESLFKDEKALKVAKDFLGDVSSYEELKTKIKNNILDFSEKDLMTLNNCLLFNSIRMENQIKSLLKTKGFIDTMILTLTDKIQDKESFEESLKKLDFNI